jgi:phosphohistidine phosphatase
MTKLYLLRHGQADWPDWNRPDDERPLTAKGRKEMNEVAAVLAAREVRPDVLLASPLPRALQTAQIAAEALGLPVTVEPSLGSGFGEPALRKILTQHAGRDVMLVGHEPSLSEIVESITGAVIVMPKAGLVRIDLNAMDPPAGELRWLIPPKFLKE